jgi:hypothetical protein
MASCQRRTPQRFLIFSTVIVLAATTVIIATKASWAGKTTSGRRAENPRHEGVVPLRFRRDLDRPVPARRTRVRLAARGPTDEHRPGA